MKQYTSKSETSTGTRKRGSVFQGMPKKTWLEQKHKETQTRAKNRKKRK